MKRTILSPEQAAWLSDTFARNRSTFGGFRMEAEGEGGDGGSGGGSGEAGGSGSGDAGGSGKPYEGKSIAEMTADERASYFEDKSRQNENRLKDVLKITGGKYGDALRAEFSDLESLRDKGRTDSERAVEEARTETRTAIQREYGTKLVAAEFRAALAHVVDGEDTTRRDQIIEGLNLSTYLTTDGDVDADKVQQYANTIAPADKEKGKRERDYGGGRRSSSTTTGVNSGRDLFASRRKTSTTNS